jgi:NADH-quinone oxidoreductase E subunit
MAASAPTTFTNQVVVTDEVAQFSPEVEKEVAWHIAKYPADRIRSAILPLLFVMQRERGYLDNPGINYVAEKLKVKVTDVWETATFYSMLNVKPMGRHHIQVCKTLSCKIMGEPGITAHLTEKLGIHPGETTADGKYSLSLVECLGSCGTAPMFQIGFDYYEDLTNEKVDQILDSLD